MSTASTIRARRNRAAGRRLRQIRSSRGLSPEQLGDAITLAGAGTVSGKTIRRIECYGVIPQVRTRFVLGTFLGFDHTEMWPPETPARSVVVA